MRPKRQTRTLTCWQLEKSHEAHLASHRGSMVRFCTICCSATRTWRICSSRCTAWMLRKHPCRFPNHSACSLSSSLVNFAAKVRNLREKTSGFEAKILCVGSNWLIYSHKKNIVYYNNVLIKIVYLLIKIKTIWLFTFWLVRWVGYYKPLEAHCSAKSRNFKFHDLPM